MAKSPRAAIEAIPAEAEKWHALKAWMEDEGYVLIRRRMAEGVKLPRIAAELNAQGYRRSDGSELHGPALSSLLHRMATRRARPPKQARQHPDAPAPRRQPAPEFRVAKPKGET